MPHCQICLTESPNHKPDCPVFTQKPVSGHSGPPIDQNVLQQIGQSQQSGMMGSGTYFGSPQADWTYCPYCGHRLP
jgi:hypothetical protein